ncbi:hypothetical protein IWQ60_007232 [Tieghemiomyces parasiticus]|uniref:Uncharacterized protein n=1 Tax=Tieghemiomyces parasiticus TaxID=78921 RepID=A0A9W8A2E5_9FUNG|nr:hypothetical protein IWQ60_007232 [Tieghemiomyces parasiticus]
MMNIVTMLDWSSAPEFIKICEERQPTAKDIASVNLKLMVEFADDSHRQMNPDDRQGFYVKERWPTLVERHPKDAELAYKFYRYFGLEILERASMVLPGPLDNTYRILDNIQDSIFSSGTDSQYSLRTPAEARQAIVEAVDSIPLSRYAQPKFISLTTMDPIHFAANYPWLTSVPKLTAAEIINVIAGLFHDRLEFFYRAITEHLAFHPLDLTGENRFNLIGLVHSASKVYDEVVTKIMYETVWRLSKQNQFGKMADVLEALPQYHSKNDNGGIATYRQSVQLALTIAADQGNEAAVERLGDIYTVLSTEREFVTPKQTLVRCLLKNKLPRAAQALASAWSMVPSDGESQLVHPGEDPCYEHMFDTRLVRYFEGGQFEVMALPEAMWPARMEAEKGDSLGPGRSLD